MFFCNWSKCVHSIIMHAWSGLQSLIRSVAHSNQGFANFRLFYFCKVFIWFQSSTFSTGGPEDIQWVPDKICGYIGLSVSICMYSGPEHLYRVRIFFFIIHIQSWIELVSCKEIWWKKMDCECVQLLELFQICLQCGDAIQEKWYHQLWQSDKNQMVLL